MSRNDDYTTGNLLDYLYHQIIYWSIPQQINFTGKLEEDYGGKMFFNTEK